MEAILIDWNKAKQCSSQQAIKQLELKCFHTSDYYYCACGVRFKLEMHISKPVMSSQPSSLQWIDFDSNRTRENRCDNCCIFELDKVKEFEIIAVKKYKKLLL